MRPIFRLKSVLLALLATTLAGCVYRMNIQQGNYLEAKTVDQVQVGMTRSQVRYLLGTPMIPDAFDKSRWDYVYYLKKGRLRAPEQRHLVVRFENDKVTRIDRDAIPPATAQTSTPEAPRESRAPVEASDAAATRPEISDASQPGERAPLNHGAERPFEQPARAVDAVREDHL